MIPKKLAEGDKIRIVAPSRSLAIISQENIKLAALRLEELGFIVTYGKNVWAQDEFDSSSIEQRVSDLHEAYSDREVKGILSVIGGFNSNQLLKYLEYDLIRNNPKIFCGYSDITALHNAIYAKTGIVSYNGPNFSNFSMKKGLDYTLEGFKKCIIGDEPFMISPSEEWADDKWYLDQETRNFIRNEGFRVINQGLAKGRIIGGNLCTLNLLQGTEFMPSLKDTVLFIEDDYESKPSTFDRDLVSLIHQHEFDGVGGILIGKFQKESGMTDELLTKIIKTKRELSDIPVIVGLDFGHTTPQITFPIGGIVDVIATDGSLNIKIVEH